MRKVLLIFSALLITSFSQSDESYVTRSKQHWNSYVSEINVAIGNFKGTVGIVVKDLTNGYTYSYNADKLFVSASLIKLPIMVAVFKAFIDNKLSFTDTCILTNASRVSGSGILQYKPSGTKYTIYELVYTMIAKSDNTAAYMLAQMLGFDCMNGVYKQIGLKNTNITQKSFDLTNGEIAGDSYTTARDIAFLLEEIYNQKMFRRYVSHQMTEIMKLTVDKKRLNKYLPKNFQLAHKTGLLRGACHDAGIVFSPYSDFLICILTNANGNYYHAKDFISHIGKITYEHLEKS